MSAFRFALLGNPVSKSKSPFIFSLFSKLTGMQLEYGLFSCDERNLFSVIKKLYLEGYRGFNVTLPHKTAVFSLIQDKLPEASCGALNCVRFIRNDDGMICAGSLSSLPPEIAQGSNTDAAAFLWALKEKIAGSGKSCSAKAVPWHEDSFSDEEKNFLSGKSALIFGTGGAARASAWAFGKTGFGKVFFCGRSIKKAESLAVFFRKIFPKTVFSSCEFPADGIFSIFSESACNKCFSAADVIVNATPLGMYGDDNAPQTFACAGKQNNFKLVADWPYRSGGTSFAKAAEECGAFIISGQELLMRQAVLSLRFWTGMPEDIVSFARRAIEMARQEGGFF